MSSVRTKRIAAAAIGLATAVGITLGVSASPALAATGSARAVTPTLTKPSAIAHGDAQETHQSQGSAAASYYCDYNYNGYYTGYDGQLHYGNYYYPCNRTLPIRIPDSPGGSY
ncbi:MAG: hypothetical protein ACREQ5_13615 [Candidatus Dormibacteria bacterium]